MSEKEARALLLRDDQERRKWTKDLYGVDPWDSSLYDLVVRIHKLTVDDAVELICHAVTRDQFKTSKEGRRRLQDLAIACQVKAALVNDYFDVGVTSEYGNVLVYTKAGDRLAHKLEERARHLAGEIQGINNLEMRTDIPFPPNAV